jgi:hypothetical protein
MRIGTLAGLVAQAADDRHLRTQFLQRIEDHAHLEIAAGRLRAPVVSHGAVRNVNETHAQRSRGGLCLRSRHHGVEKRQRNGGACTAKYVSA